MFTRSRAISTRFAVLGSAFLGIVALVTACKSHDPANTEALATAAPSATPAPSASAAPLGAPVDAPDPTAIAPATEIKLVSKGSGPTKMLSYRFREGTEKKFTIDLSIEPKVSLGGQAMPGNGMVQLKVVGRIKVTKVLPDGKAERVSSFESIQPAAKDLPPEAIAQLTQQLASLTGLKVADVVNAQGHVERLTLLGGNTVPPQAQALVSNVSQGTSHALFRLPAAEVGAGAEWIETSVMDLGGVSMKNEYKYKLVKISGASIEVTLTSKQFAPPKKLPTDGMPPGTSLELVKLDGSGKGKLKLDLDSLDLSADLSSVLLTDTKAQSPQTPMPIENRTETKTAIVVSIVD